MSAAFRRVPLDAAHRLLAMVVFWAAGVLYASMHYAMPFGSLAAVYAWERLAVALWNIVTQILFVPSGKYVDDFYILEEEEIIQETLDCVVLVFRALLGPESLAEKKILCGNPLTILGFQVFAGSDFAQFTLDECKRDRWLLDIEKYLEANHLSPREAACLAGRLAFACLFLFRRLGRAMVRPIFARQYSACRNCTLTRALRSALVWWKTALAESTCGTFFFNPPAPFNCDLFCDASGANGGYIAAVLVIGSRAFYVHAPVPSEWRDWVEPRNDSQIMAWELLSILLGLNSFKSLLAGRTFRIWSDNYSGCHSVIRGGARAVDHNYMVHKFWSVCFEQRMNPWLETVPSDDNIADGPTRADFYVLESLGASLLVAQVPSVY